MGVCFRFGSVKSGFLLGMTRRAGFQGLKRLLGRQLCVEYTQGSVKENPDLRVYELRISEVLINVSMYS